MGKVRRLRQKYHMLKKKGGDKKEDLPKGLTYEDIVSGSYDKINLPSKSDLESNIFSGVNIDIGKLKTSLIEDDKVSVRSVAKSLKYDSSGKLLKKNEKRKLRHELFMKKLDIVQQMRHEARRKKKKNKSGNNIQNISDELPQLVKIENRKPNKPIKKKGIEKAKKRQKNMFSIL
ncbi:uncharacterized protein LOC142329604 isoform X2 [Lycorma delicatula]|uniref:uncharacterized protein LOC142329604 isoform X2 n=1 Tax=Lycorma delicatula TaxID=130591 RepID=UPI003F50DE09